jgi:hypothetical protein
MSDGRKGISLAPFLRLFMLVRDDACALSSDQFDPDTPGAVDDAKRL